MARGDVLLVHLPSAPGLSGHEQKGMRPAVCVQAEEFAEATPTTVVVPLTGNLSALRFPHTFRVVPSKENGLTEPSAVLVFQVRAIDRRRVVRRIGTLEPTYVENLSSHLRRLLAL